MMWGDWSGPLTLHWLELVLDRIRRGDQFTISEAVEAIRWSQGDEVWW